MKILLESHQLFSKQKTGVGYYESVLESQLKKSGVSTINGVFSGTADVRSAATTSSFSHRIAIKLLSYGIALPATKLWSDSVDAYIFPDFFHFPSKKPSAVVIHDVAYLKDRNFLPGNRNRIVDFFYPGLATVLKRTIPGSLKRASVVLVTSNTAKQDLIDAYGTDESKFIVSGIPPEDMFFEERELPKLPNFPTKEFIYYQATIEPRKNHIALLKAYEKLPKNIQNKYSLVLGGRVGWKCDETMKRINDMQSTGLNIAHLDYVSDELKLALYKSTSLYIQPSHYEGFGMPLLEAMVSNAPVVCSDIPIFREVCEDAAVYFDKDSPESIADTIEETLKDKKLQTKLKTAGKNRVEYYRNDDSGIKELISRLSLKN